MLAFDPETATLAARLPASAQSAVEALAGSSLGSTSNIVRFDLHIFEVPAPSGREIMAEASLAMNHRPLLEDLLANADAGDVTLVAETRVETKSGLRVKTTAVRAVNALAGIGITGDGSVEYHAEESLAGCTLELEPIVGPDQRTIDVDLALDYHFAPPVVREIPTLLTKSQITRTPAYDTVTANVSTSITMESGAAKLVGVWTPDTAGGAPDEGEFLQAAFLSGGVVHVLPNANATLAAWLETHGDAIAEIPPGEPVYDQPEGDLPPGMIVRRFQISPRLFQSMLESGRRDGSHTADPFASDSEIPARREPRFTVDATGQDILEAVGIPFPDGASANYLIASGELVVRNLPANIDLVEQFLPHTTPRSPLVALTAHVVEAPASFLRGLARQALAQSDHSAAWESLEEAAAGGNATIRRSWWIEAKSGQRVRLDAGQNYTSQDEAAVSPVASTAPTKDDKAATAAGGSILSLAYETRLVGLRFEVDPIIGPDHETLDLNLYIEYDYAAPQHSVPRIVGADGEPVIDPGATTFHEAQVICSTTLLTGTTRLLALWNPADPAAEPAEPVLQAVFVRADIVLSDSGKRAE
ncbi:hypothetical protein BH23VER1_BH23VER1_10410 [soil metagenome]